MESGSSPASEASATPASEQQSADQLAWQQIKRCETKEGLVAPFATVMARLAAEAWIGLATTFKAPDEEKLAYIHTRAQNAWLLQVWSAVDASWDNRSEPNSPENLALYLTLGWTQATTTHQWPATERWIAVLSGEPPEHWLPRSQWHVCWLLADQGDAEHRRAFLAAIAEGRQDAERPGMADELVELLGIE